MGVKATYNYENSLQKLLFIFNINGKYNIVSKANDDQKQSVLR